MPIQKEKTLPSGVTGNYWRITTITIDRQRLRVVASIALFKDKQASDEGKAPMALTKVVRFPFVVSEALLAPDLISYIYTKIKDAAEVVITKDIMGNDLPVPTTVDPDLAGGTIVAGN